MHSLTPDELAAMERLRAQRADYWEEYRNTRQGADEAILAAALLRLFPALTEMSNDIREADGNHDLGAGELAERAMGWRKLGVPKGGGR